MAPDSVEGRSSQFANPATQASAGNLDNNRLILARTFNFTAPPGGSTDVGFIQVGTWWWQPAPGSTGSKMTVTHHYLGKRIGG